MGRQTRLGLRGKAKTRTKAEATHMVTTGRRVDLVAVEDELRHFDLCCKYGPVSGMTRLERWQRAEDLGLNPSERIRSLLELRRQHPHLNEHLWRNVYI